MKTETASPAMLRKSERKILETAEYEAERQLSYGIELQKKWSDSLLPPFFITIFLCVLFYKNELIVLYLLVPLIVRSLWLLWKEGRMDEVICIHSLVWIHNVICLTYLSGMLIKEREYRLFIIYGLIYGPIFIKEYIESINE